MKEIDVWFAEKKKEIMLTNFNNNTWQDNQTYTQNQLCYKCIYSSPTPISSTIPLKTGLFVLEANIQINRIEGIGYLKLDNNERHCKYIYKDPKYNQYTYYGKYHINRADMTPDEEVIMILLDTLCFTGKSHLKRYRGINRFPKKWVYRVWMGNNLDLIAMLSMMFKVRFENKKTT